MAFADNILNVRLQLKYDSLENWARENPLLKAGEVAIAYLPPKGNGEAPAATSEAVLMKVGPGNFNSLPFTSALAADVYGWAKENELKFSKAGTGNVVSGIEWDATLNGNKGGIKFTTASVATSEGLEEVQNDIAAIEKDISDNRAAWAKDDNTTYTFAKSADGKGITITPSEGNGSTISFAFLTQAEIEALNYLVKADITTGSANGTIAVEGADVAVKGLQDAAYTTVSALNATAKGYADAVEAKIPTELGVMSVAEGNDTITIGGTAANPTIVVTANKFDAYGAAAAVQTGVENGTVKAKVAETADKVANSLTVGSKTYNGSEAISITAADLGLSNALHFVGTSYPSNPVAGDVVLDGNKEYVYDGSKWIELGDESSHALNTITITGTDGLEGGGNLTENRTLKIADSGVTTVKIANDAVTADKLADAINTDIAKGVTAHGWGNHANAGYAKTADLGDLATLDTITSEKVTDFENAVNNTNIGGTNEGVTVASGLNNALDRVTTLESNKVDKTTTVNGKALSESINIYAENIHVESDSVMDRGVTVYDSLEAIAKTTINGETILENFSAGDYATSRQFVLNGETLKMSGTDTTTLNAAITARQTEAQVNALIEAALGAITTINCGSSTEVI